jgi:hypothetical protein
MILSGSIDGVGTITGSTQPEALPLEAIDLIYSDADSDSRIDTLEIRYPYVLTGSVNTGAILLYSKTG